MKTHSLLLLVAAAFAALAPHNAAGQAVVKQQRCLWLRPDSTLSCRNTCGRFDLTPVWHQESEGSVELCSVVQGGRNWKGAEPPAGHAVPRACGSARAPAT